MENISYDTYLEVINKQQSKGYSSLTDEDKQIIKAYRIQNPNYNTMKDIPTDDEDEDDAYVEKFYAYIQWEMTSASGEESSSYEHINSIDELIEWANNLRGK